MWIIHRPYCTSYISIGLPVIISHYLPECESSIVHTVFVMLALDYLLSFSSMDLFYARAVQSQRGVERVAGLILPYLQLLVGMQFVPCRFGALLIYTVRAFKMKSPLLFKKFMPPALKNSFFKLIFFVLPFLVFMIYRTWPWSTTFITGWMAVQVSHPQETPSSNLFSTSRASTIFRKCLLPSPGRFWSISKTPPFRRILWHVHK